jgi:hypothetical protein
MVHFTQWSSDSLIDSSVVSLDRPEH